MQAKARLSLFRMEMFRVLHSLSRSSQFDVVWSFLCVRERAVGNLSSLNPLSWGVFPRAVTNLVGIFHAAPSLSHVGSKERQQWLACCLKDNWKNDFIRGHSSRNVGMLSRITLHRECWHNTPYDRVLTQWHNGGNARVLTQVLTQALYPQSQSVVG